MYGVMLAIVHYGPVPVFVDLDVRRRLASRAGWPRAPRIVGRCVYVCGAIRTPERRARSDLFRRSPV